MVTSHNLMAFCFPDREPPPWPPVAKTPVRTHIHVSLYIHGHLTTQITFDLHTLIDYPAYDHDLIV